MAFIKTTVEGIDIEYWKNQTPKVGEYGLYRGKIYRVVSTEGIGKYRAIGLSRKGHRTFYKPWKAIDKLHLIIKPTGYIKID